MKKEFFLICIMSLLTAGTLLYAQSSTEQDNGARLHRHPRGINLSLWKGVATQSNDSTGSSLFNLGIFSSMNNLTGVGINLIGSNAQRDVYGIQLAGISNSVGQQTVGLQIAGITNINGNGYKAVSVSGLVGINGDEGTGAAIAGLANISGDTNRGMALAGLMNFIGNRGAGLLLSGIANISGNGFHGMALAGLMNVSGGSYQGVHGSGLINITEENLKGIQVAGLGNVTGGELKGVQIGLANMATRAKGVQIGLFNYYKEQFDGIQLGLVNANPHTRIQLLAYGGNCTKLNLAARFKNNHLYTLIGAGSPYQSFNDKFSAALSYRAGAEIHLYKQLYISGDLGFQHIETFQKNNDMYPQRLYSLQTRINLEYRLTHSMGVFVTGGYGWDLRYNHRGIYKQGTIIEGGIVLFKY